jgi:RNA polymerase sigma factor (sigma-70 family)
MTNAGLPRYCPTLADGELLAAVARGDLESLGVLYDRHESAVRRCLGRLGVPAGDIDDLVQTAFLEAARSAGRFDPTLPARAWLLGIAAMLVRRHRRSVARAFARALHLARQPEPLAPTRPDEAYDSDQDARRLAAAIAGLAPKKREVFVLCTVEGLSGEEVARALGVPVNTVWTRLHHARIDLRAALGGER